MEFPPMEIPIYGEIVMEILWKNPSFPQAPGPPIGLDGPKARRVNPEMVNHGAFSTALPMSYIENHSFSQNKHE